MTNSIINRIPTPPVRLNPSVSPELERIITKALEKRRELRYQSAADMRVDLTRALRDTQSGVSHGAATASRTHGPRDEAMRARWKGLLAAGVLVALVGTGAVVWRMLGRTDPAPAAAQAVAPSIAVLPFMDMSPEKNQEYFSDGLAEELLNSLAKIPGLRVAARTSSFQFKGKTEDLRTVAEKLNVSTILEGSVRTQGGRVRITAQLIKVSDGFHLWSETYDRELRDIFAVQDDIARAVAGSLQVALLGEKAASPRRARTSRPTTRSFRDATSMIGEARRTSRGPWGISNRPSSWIRTTLPRGLALQMSAYRRRLVATSRFRRATVRRGRRRTAH